MKGKKGLRKRRETEDRTAGGKQARGRGTLETILLGRVVEKKNKSPIKTEISELGNDHDL